MDFNTEYTITTEELQKIKTKLYNYNDAYYCVNRAGLTNISSSCWFSASIQMMLFMPDFIVSILDKSNTKQINDDTDGKKQNIFKNFLKTQLLTTQESLIDKKSIKNVINECIGSKLVGGHQDAPEGLIFLLNLFEPKDLNMVNNVYNYNSNKNFYVFKTLYKKHSNESSEYLNIYTLGSEYLNIDFNTWRKKTEILDNNNLYKIHYKIPIKECDTIVKNFVNKLTDDTFVNLLQVNIDIAHSINKYIKEKLDINELNTKNITQYFVKKNNNAFSLYSNINEEIIEEINKYFIIHLKLFDKKKLKKTTTKFKLQYNFIFNDNKYILSGFIAHSGTATGGHYTFYKIKSWTQTEKTYILYNDESTTKHNISDINSNLEEFTKTDTEEIYIKIKESSNFTPYLLLYENITVPINLFSFNLNFNDFLF